MLTNMFHTATYEMCLSQSRYLSSSGCRCFIFISHLMLFVHHIITKLGRCSCFMIIFTFCILRAFPRLPLLYGLRFIIEGRNRTCRILNVTVIWWIAESWTIMPFVVLVAEFSHDTRNHCQFMTTHCQCVK